jgi:hypothetical protein
MLVAPTSGVGQLLLPANLGKEYRQMTKLVLATLLLLAALVPTTQAHATYCTTVGNQTVCSNSSGGQVSCRQVLNQVVCN